MRCADWPVKVNKVQQAAGASSAPLSGQPRSSEPCLARTPNPHTDRSQGCLPAYCACLLRSSAWFCADGSQSEPFKRRLPLLQAPTADATRLTGQHSKPRTKNAFKQLVESAPVAHGRPGPDSGFDLSHSLSWSNDSPPPAPHYETHLCVTPEPHRAVDNKHWFGENKHWFGEKRTMYPSIHDRIHSSSVSF